MTVIGMVVSVFAMGQVRKTRLVVEWASAPLIVKALRPPCLQHDLERFKWTEEL